MTIRCVNCDVELNESECTYQDDLCDHCFKLMCDAEIAINNDQE